MKSQLDKIHKSVFENFQYQTDKEQYGKEEVWEYIPETFTFGSNLIGDCEAFALACRKLCRDEGIESRLVVCHTEEGEGHCVLEVDGYVLDNRQRKVVTKDYLESKGYEWLGISGFNKGDPWYKVK